VTQIEQPNELIVLVDDNGNELGAAPKLASHHLNTPLHKAFSCYIFNDKGQLLVTQRALSKKVWPGVWTNSVCGHPGPNESDIDAIARRAFDEVGAKVSDVSIVLPDYRYVTPPFQGVIENELCPVYFARLAADVRINPEEVEAYQWMSWQEYRDALTAESNAYSYWAKDQYAELLKHQDAIDRYSTAS